MGLVSILKTNDMSDIKIKASDLVEKFILSYGEKVSDYNEVFYNKKQSIGINIVSYLNDFAEDILEHSDQQAFILTQKLMEANHQLDKLNHYNLILNKQKLELQNDVDGLKSKYDEVLKEREMFKDALIKLGDSYIELKSQADAMAEALVMAKTYCSNTNVIDAIDRILTNYKGGK